MSNIVPFTPKRIYLRTPRLGDNLSVYVALNDIVLVEPLYARQGENGECGGHRWGWTISAEEGAYEDGSRITLSCGKTVDVYIYALRVMEQVKSLNIINFDAGDC